MSERLEKIKRDLAWAHGMEKSTAQWRDDIAYILEVLASREKEIADLKREVKRLELPVAVTEELLRRNDGYIHVGHGCELAIRGTTKQLQDRDKVIKEMRNVLKNLIKYSRANQSTEGWQSWTALQMDFDSAIFDAEAALNQNTEGKA